MMKLCAHFLLILPFCRCGHSAEIILNKIVSEVFQILLKNCFPHRKGYPVPSSTTEQTEQIENIKESRRIIGGVDVFDTRPYMVYLRPATLTHVDLNWLCGGVIIAENFILTSAACIEDIENFYVVSGTHKWVPPDQTTECIRNGAIRAVWKCVPRSYRYDGASFNNIRWMVNDIAVVMTEESISFQKKVKGCDFIPDKIDYNNITKEWEMPGTKGFIAGWGSNDVFTDPDDLAARTRVNSPFLMEAETIIITKKSCRQRWLPRYYHIIQNYMICAKQIPMTTLSNDCRDNHASCRQLLFSEEVGPRTRRFERDPEKLLLESAAQVRRMEKTRKLKTRRDYPARTANKFGGFCENDHGGPLVVGQGTSAIVVGIISAFRVMDNSKNCYGPFLYTSVYNNRHLIQCALYKGLGDQCKTVLRDSSSVLEEERFDWKNFPGRARARYEDEDDGPVLKSVTTTEASTQTSDTTTEPPKASENPGSN